MITIAQAGLGAVVALARGRRLDGVLSPVFSPSIVVDDNGDPVRDQPDQPRGKITGGVVTRSDGDRVVVDFGAAGWADAPLADLELIEAAPRPAGQTRGGEAAAAAEDASSVKALIARCDELQGRVEALEADAATRAENAKRATSPTARFITAGDADTLIQRVAAQIVDSKLQSVNQRVAAAETAASEGRGLAERATDEVATLSQQVSDLDSIVVGRALDNAGAPPHPDGESREKLALDQLMMPGVDDKG